MKNNKLNAVPVSKHFEDGRAEARPYNGSTPITGRALRSSPRESSGQAGQALRTSGQAKARPYNGSTPIMKDKKLLAEHSCDEKKRQPFGFAQDKQGCPSATLRVNRTPKVDAESLWKQIEDVVVPQLRLSVIDHVVYIHLVRHSRLEGRRRLRFSILWLARNIHLSGGPTREAVRRLAGHGALRLIERSKAGHVAEVRLPEEIPGVRARAKRARKAARLSGANGIEDVDFLKTVELRRAIHARERGRCFYCLRQIPARLACIDHVVPRARVGCNSYRNLVSSCMECNSEKGERLAEEFVRGLYRERSLTAAELKNRLRALDALAAGKLRPTIPSEGGPGSQA
jgi:5-methylcytosine-specific restriction endonuclease McrA